jgi:protease I
MADTPEDTYLPELASRNTGSKILIMTADDTEDLEFFYPYYRFLEAGYKVDVVTPDGGKFEAKHGLGLKETRKITDVNADDYDLLYLPGGKAPAKLKKNDDAIALTKKFVATKRPVAAVCHGPQILAAADCIKGKRIAAWPEVKDEVEEAGATYVNEATVVDGQFITARWPGDLPSHMKAALQALQKGAKTAYSDAA